MFLRLLGLFIRTLVTVSLQLSVIYVAIVSTDDVSFLFIYQCIFVVMCSAALGAKVLDLPDFEDCASNYILMFLCAFWPLWVLIAIATIPLYVMLCDYGQLWRNTVESCSREDA